MILLLQLSFFLDLSFVKHVDIDIIIYNIVKNLLIQWETEEEN